ncbi:MAG: hypothetical protein LR015_05250 [Verrucomicrobia bacterium]|nr:hypothetical protein [Verrucomicrobiota bacterium]
MDPLDKDVLKYKGDSRFGIDLELVNWFIDLIKDLPIEANAEGWRGELRQARVDAFSKIITCLEPVNIANVTYSLQFELIRYELVHLKEEHKPFVVSEFKEVCVAGLSTLAANSWSNFPRRRGID